MCFHRNGSNDCLVWQRTLIIGSTPKSVWDRKWKLSGRLSMNYRVQWTNIWLDWPPKEPAFFSPLSSWCVFVLESISIISLRPFRLLCHSTKFVVIFFLFLCFFDVSSSIILFTYKITNQMNSECRAPWHRTHTGSFNLVLSETNAQSSHIFGYSIFPPFPYITKHGMSKTQAGSWSHFVIGIISLQFSLMKRSF